MEIKFNPNRQLQVPKYAKQISKKIQSQRAGKLTAGDVNSIMTGGKLKKFFVDNKVHPTVIKKLHGAGFFDNIVNGIKKATKFVIDNKDNIAKGIKFGKQAIETGKQGYDLYKSLKSKPVGGKLTAGKLSPAMRKRSEAMGMLMTGKKYTMAQASEIYKIMQQGNSMTKATQIFNKRQ
jgi:hypothetical protein